MGPSRLFGTLVEVLQRRACEQPDDVAFLFVHDGVHEVARLTYADLDRRARAVACHLQTLGAPGDRALLLYPPGLEFIPAFFGCLYAGLVAVPAYPPGPNQSLSRLKTILDDAKAKFVFSTSSVLSMVGDRLPDGMEAQLVASDTLADDDGRWRAPDLNGETLALLQYTSGSTGRPKGVMVSHANLLHNQQMIMAAFGHTEAAVVVGWLPVFHDMGLIGNILQPLYLGARCILMSPVEFIQRPVRWLQAISHHKATTSGAPNFAYDLCARKVTAEQKATLDLRTWTVAFNGAEPVRAETLERFVGAFSECGFRRETSYPCYGMAEATLIISGGAKAATPKIVRIDAARLAQNVVAPVEADGGAPDREVRTLVSAGHAWLNQRIAIVNPDTLAQCPPDEVGEIWISGESVAQGYWNRPSETKDTFHAYLSGKGEGPFLRTGDLGFVRDGELFVTGRIKDMIIIRGRNHYPQDIEETVQQSHPALRPSSGAAFAVEIDALEQLVVAQEVARDWRRQEANADEVMGNIRQALASQHGLQAHTIVLVKTATIPKTSSGKIQRQLCRTKFLNGGLEVVRSWSCTA